ncbi:GPW/gp25 family protein [Mucilaginibacter angelicae]|uniref:GPW/gp25 family protein n=1 Tax=Mucilaginibacter angelicae TaxID=869718 RepID=A0ABV6LF60_9SPHI
MDNQEAFLGRGWSFPPQFFAKGNQVAMVSAEEDINQSLFILFSTALKERVMFPEYGSDMSDYVFEEMSQSLINSLQDSVTTAILKNEPRIITESVQVSAGNLQGRLDIAIVYTIPATNNRYNMIYPFYLNEANT